jgi:predicted ArsR family transcriptional regulator
MITTKGQILAHLKRNGGYSVKELAEAVNLSPVTVRQHLTHLQRDGLVTAEQHRNGRGRPQHRFRLTARGHAAAFPGRSDRIVELLLREIGRLNGAALDGLCPAERTRRVLQSVAERLADEFQPVLHKWPLDERVAFITEVMHSDGGFSEWEAVPGGYEIRDYNCLFHRLLDDGDHGCDWHRTFLSRTLGTEVRVVPCADNERCCRYLVLRPETAAASV